MVLKLLLEIFSLFFLFFLIYIYNDNNLLIKVQKIKNKNSAGSVPGQNGKFYTAFARTNMDYWRKTKLNLLMMEACLKICRGKEKTQLPKRKRNGLIHNLLLISLIIFFLLFWEVKYVKVKRLMKELKSKIYSGIICFVCGAVGFKEMLNRPQRGGKIYI